MLKLLPRDLPMEGSQHSFMKYHILRSFVFKYCADYTMVGPTYKTDGFGFINSAVFFFGNLKIIIGNMNKIVLFWYRF